MDKNYKCADEIKKNGTPCNQSECRYALKSFENLNCALIAADKGPMTLQEIGDFYGISRMRVCQIEKSILKKLKNHTKSLSDFDPSSG
jgi:hypothetical protein